MPFIKINGRILDKQKYEKEAFLLKKLVEYEINEAVRKYGFKKKGNSFINKGMAVTIVTEIYIRNKKATINK